MRWITRLSYHTSVKFLTRICSIQLLNLWVDYYSLWYTIFFYDSHTDHFLGNRFQETINNPKAQYTNYYENSSITFLIDKVWAIISENSSLFNNRHTIYWCQYSPKIRVLLSTKNHWLQYKEFFLLPIPYLNNIFVYTDSS